MKRNNRHSNTFGYKRISQLLIAFTIVSSTSVMAAAGPGDLERAKRMHDRLAGVTATDAVLTSMADLIGDGTPELAADIAMENPAFYNATLKNFAAPWTNEPQTVFVPLNDYTATVIGMIRDSATVDFRSLLSADILYTGPNVGTYSDSNNNHYETLDSTDLKVSLTQRVQSAVTKLQSNQTAGVMTTRAAAEAFFIAGTNRAQFRFTLMNHLCTDLEPLKDVTRVPDRVRRDVSRSPGGDSRLFLNQCVGCHAGMDGMAGAFAHYEFDPSLGDNGEIVYNDTGSALYDATTGVSLKHNINATNFKYGYITVDDSWINYWRNGQNSSLGWSTTLNNDDGKGHETGNGASSLGQELANSTAFASCQVKKAFKAVCLRNP